MSPDRWFRFGSCRKVTPLIFLASASSFRYGVELECGRVTAYVTIAAAKITTSTVVTISAQGVCFWLTMDFPGRLVGPREPGPREPCPAPADAAPAPPFGAGLRVLTAASEGRPRVPSSGLAVAALGDAGRLAVGLAVASAAESAEA